VILSASLSAFSFASAPVLTKNTVSRPSPGSAPGAWAARCGFQRHGIALEQQASGLLLERGLPARVRVAEGRDACPP